MKKMLFVISLLLMTAWITGTFLLRAPFLVHTLLVLSIIVYIRSLLIITTDPVSKIN